MPYARENTVAKAVKLGYTHVRNTDTGSSFRNGTRHIWSFCRAGGRPMWQTADLIDNFYTGHEAFETLSEAIERPLLEESKDG